VEQLSDGSFWMAAFGWQLLDGSFWVEQRFSAALKVLFQWRL